MTFGAVFPRAFRPAFGPGLAAGGAANGLLNNLVAYWKLDEASGNAADAHSNGLTLTAQAAPGADTGIVYGTARTFNGSTQYFSRASESLLQTGNVDFTAAVWVYADALVTREMWPFGKLTSSPGEWYINYTASNGGGGNANKMRFVIRNAEVVYSNAFGGISAATWYLVVAWHDATAGTISIAVNDVATTTARTTGPSEKSDIVFIGGSSIYTTVRWAGRLGPAMFWKSAAGGGGVLDATKRAALFNGGAGLPYSSFTT